MQTNSLGCSLSSAYICCHNLVAQVAAQSGLSSWHRWCGGVISCTTPMAVSSPGRQGWKRYVISEPEVQKYFFLFPRYHARESDTSDYISPSSRAADHEVAGDFRPSPGLNKLAAIKNIIWQRRQARRQCPRGRPRFVANPPVKWSMDQLCNSNIRNWAHEGD